MELEKSKKDSLSLTKEQTEIARELIHYNQLTPYPYSDLQITQWVKSITELVPEMTPQIIKHIIDRLKTDAYEFESKKGIQNIFNGFKKYLKEKSDGYWNVLEKKYRVNAIHEHIERTEKDKEEIELLVKKRNKISDTLLFLNSGLTPEKNEVQRASDFMRGL